MREKIMLGLALVVLVALNYGVYEQEQIKAHGEILLLELAPVDPRSLMQGDYMRLRYKLEGAIHERQPEGGKTPDYIVVHPDDNKVAQFARYDNGEILSKDEKRLRVSWTGKSFSIKPNAYFFQEGHAKNYEAAKYGIFKIDSSASHQLIGLADENWQEIRVEEPIK